MLLLLIGVITMVGLANMWYYEHRVRIPKAKVIDFTGYKFKGGK